MKLICERTTFIPGFRVFTLHRNRSGVSRPLDPFNYLSSTDRYPERLTVRDLELALIEQCGMGQAAIEVLIDPDNPWEIFRSLARAATRASDVLLIYYVGHGLVSLEGELHLTTAT